MKTQIKLMSIVAGMLLLGLSSCKKDNELGDFDTNSTIENAAMDAAYDDVSSISDEAYTGSLESFRTGGNEKIMTTCATISFDTVSNPKSFTIDFGTVDCLCKDGTYRRGKIIVSYSDQYRDSASTHTITFDNYYANYNKIEGTKTVTNNGRNANGNLSFTVSVNGSITWDPQYFAGGGTSTYASTRTREWIAGETTFLWSDDIYLISGSTSGTNRAGGAYTLTTTEPLRKEIGFRHFTDGVLEFTPAGKYTRIIDYGYVSGGRDKLAQVTINGRTFTITLY